MKSKRYQTNARRSFHSLGAMESRVVSAGLHILSCLRAGPASVLYSITRLLLESAKTRKRVYASQLETMFERMGARVKFARALADTRWDRHSI